MIVTLILRFRNSIPISTCLNFMHYAFPSMKA